jgi:hypothetical protein
MIPYEREVATAVRLRRDKCNEVAICPKVRKTAAAKFPWRQRKRRTYLLERSVQEERPLWN